VGGMGWGRIKGGGSRLRAGRTGVLILVRAADFLICKHVKTLSVSYRTSTIIVTRFLSRR